MKYLELIKRFDLLFLKRRVLLQKDLFDIGLHPGQFPIMKYVITHDSCSQIDIAKALELSPASVAISTKRLQKAGMLTKAVDEKNLRSKKLTATENGRRKAEACHNLFMSFDSKMFAGFTEAELAQLTGYLDRVVANICEEQEKIENLKFSHMLALENQLMDPQKAHKKETKPC